MTDPEAYRRYARPGIVRAAERDSEIYAFAAVGTICRSYNLLLERAAREPELDALVLLQQEIEILDEDFCAKAREALRDDSVAAVGAIGARGVESIAWWDGEISSGTVVQRYQEHGGGELPAFSWKPHAPAPAEVDTLEGFLLVLSPWAVRNVRFDESLRLGHGYDLDFCLRLREAGKRVTTADFHVRQHRASLDLVEEHELWVEGYMQAAKRLEGRIPGVPAPSGSWKERARRMEAEREAARTIAYSTGHQAEARLAPLEREVEEIEQSLSWRITEPLRRANAWRRRLRRR